MENGFDIALLKLDEEADLTIPDLVGEEYQPRSGETFAAIGWGVSGESNELSQNLVVVQNLIFIPMRSCNIPDYWAGLIKDNMLCAGLGEDSCEGDLRCLLTATASLCR